jgi:redox-sensitive bicupin YhaK (pirin superfamily)
MLTPTCDLVCRFRLQCTHAGESIHEDFKGNKGHMGPGDVQFMIAGRGILHSEMPVVRPDLPPPTGLQL